MEITLERTCPPTWLLYYYITVTVLLYNLNYCSWNVSRVNGSTLHATELKISSVRKYWLTDKVFAIGLFDGGALNKYEFVHLRYTSCNTFNDHKVRKKVPKELTLMVVLRPKLLLRVLVLLFLADLPFPPSSRSSAFIHLYYQRKHIIFIQKCSAYTNIKNAVVW